MKLAGKKAGLMPKDKESKSEDKGENEGTESKTTKKTGKFSGKSNRLGGGGRFAQMEAKGASPALAAFVGRKLYGAKKMAKMSSAGRKRASA